MRATIDETLEFEQEALEVSSYRRDSVERNVSGLDGVISIDLGMRKRELLQKGVIRAGSAEALRSGVHSFSELIDGGIHRLVLENGEVFDDLRVDTFVVLRKGHSGAGPSCNFEISYTQLTNHMENLK